MVDEKCGDHFIPGNTVPVRGDRLHRLRIIFRLHRQRCGLLVIVRLFFCRAVSPVHARRDGMFPLCLSDRYGEGHRLHATCREINGAGGQHISVIQERYRNAAIGKGRILILDFHRHGHHAIRGQLCCRQRQFRDCEIVVFPAPHGGQGAVAVQHIALARQIKFPVPAVPPTEKDITGFGRGIIRQGQGVAVAMRHRGEVTRPAAQVKFHRVLVEHIAVLNCNHAVCNAPQSAVLRLVIT